MKLELERLFAACTLFMFSMLIFYLDYTEVLYQLVQPNYIRVIQLTSVCFLFLFFIQLRTVVTDDRRREKKVVAKAVITCNRILSFIIFILPIVACYFLFLS